MKIGCIYKLVYIVTWYSSMQMYGIGSRRSLHLGLTLSVTYKNHVRHG